MGTNAVPTLSARASTPIRGRAAARSTSPRHRSAGPAAASLPPPPPPGEGQEQDRQCEGAARRGAGVCLGGRTRPRVFLVVRLPNDLDMVRMLGNVGSFLVTSSSSLISSYGGGGAADAIEFSLSKFGPPPRVLPSSLHLLLGGMAGYCSLYFWRYRLTSDLKHAARRLENEQSTECWFLYITWLA